MDMTEFCGYLHNWFTPPNGIHLGTFEIKDGSLPPLDFLSDGQYFRIVGSTFNDGVYQYPSADLTNETFDGGIWAMAVPPTVIALFHEVKDWDDKYGESASGPYQSESFGGYSYTKKSGANGNNVSSWKDAFRTRLNQYRKIR